MVAKLLSVSDIAEALGVSVYTIRAWVSQGRIPFVKLGTRTMFVPHEIQRWLDANSHRETPSPTEELAGAK